MVQREFTILIADRNPHVREFLKREMTAAGYRVRLAENGKQAVKWTYHQESLDLLILDPDLPDIEESAIVKKLRNRIPVLPVIIHTYMSDYENDWNLLTEAVFVEKQGNSIERLKQMVANMLQIAPTQSETTEQSNRIER